jgi:hypothetical protein
MLDTDYLKAYYRTIDYIAFNYRQDKGDKLGDIMDYELVICAIFTFEVPREMIAARISALREGRR